MIHATALIDPKAKLGANVSVGPWSIIGPEVEIGEGSWIGPHVVIQGPTRIGCNNQIFQFSSIGEACQDKKYKGEPTRLEIGDDNVIRESCSIHRGTVQDQGVTRIGNGNLFMVNVHLAHDVVVGDQCIIANNAAIAGHVHIGDYAVLGGFAGVHQFCRIGAHSMSGVGSVIVKDVPAFVTVSGNTAQAHGINLEGLKRRGFSKEAMRALQQAYKIVFRQGLTVADAMSKLATLTYQGPELDLFKASILSSQRGIIR